MKKGILFIKDSAPAFLVLTTVIGGIIQLFNLYIIDPYFVRFFSVTQLIGDGLWILLIFFPIYFLLPFLYLLFNGKRYDLFEKEETLNSAYLSMFFIGLFTIVSLVYAIVSNFIWALWFVIFFSGMFNIVSQEFLKKFPGRKIFMHSEAISFTLIILPLGCFIYLLTINRDLPSNIANLRQVENTISTNFPHYKQKLLYINDQYIFAKIFCDSITEKNAEIVILPIDKLFEFKQPND